jgi:Ca2+-binding EF-hand superfamily protein
MAYMEIDENNDKTLSFDEFKMASNIVEKWAGPITNLKDAFDEIDDDKSGSVDFDEFCAWAIKRSFSFNNYDNDDVQELEGTFLNSKSNT